MQQKPHDTKVTLLAALFNPKDLGESLKEVAVDVIKAEDQHITSRWFHSNKDADFYIWRDQNKNIIKQQIMFLGQVVEWNVAEGVRTGYLLEDETNHKDVGDKVIIRYDSSPQKHTIEQSVEVISAIVGLSKEDRLAAIENFIRSQLFASLSLQEIVNKYGVYLRPKDSSGFWFGWLRKLGLFKKK